VDAPSNVDALDAPPAMDAPPSVDAPSNEDAPSEVGATLTVDAPPDADAANAPDVDAKPIENACRGRSCFSGWWRVWFFKLGRVFLGLFFFLICIWFVLCNSI
jgi:hypothetical protein